jgi:hypothetical protein
MEPERIAILKGGGAVLADCRLLANVLRSDVTAQAAPVDPAAAVVAFNVRPYDNSQKLKNKKYWL